MTMPGTSNVCHYAQQSFNTLQKQLCFHLHTLIYSDTHTFFTHILGTHALAHLMNTHCTVSSLLALPNNFIIIASCHRSSFGTHIAPLAYFSGLVTRILVNLLSATKGTWSEKSHGD